VIAAIASSAIKTSTIRARDPFALRDACMVSRPSVQLDYCPLGIDPSI
jgi:hypothetical protein